MPEEIAVAEESQGTPASALLFELENIAFQGRQIIFDVIQSVLADKDMTLTPVLFSRCCVDKPLDEGLPRLLKLLGHPRVNADKLIPEIREGIRASLVDNTPKIPATLSNLLKTAQDKGYAIGTISELDDEAAVLLYAKLDIGNPDDAAIIASENAPATADPQAWQGAARSMQAIIPSCVVLATGSLSAHAAITAGMRCIALPDTYTGFQDFGGTDMILDNLDNSAAQAIMDTLAVHP